jgi:type IV pilus assembly protein PilX
MLKKRPIPDSRNQLRSGQKGVVLLITLIVLVAMTLAAIAMMRSVDTGTLISGNLAFRQAASNAGDSGIEAAITWLAQNKTGNYLQTDHNSVGDSFGYSSTRAATPGLLPSGLKQSWDDYWNTVLVPNNQVVRVKFNAAGAPDPAGANLTDNAGNAVSYTIARLCTINGDPTAAGCSISKIAATTITGFNNQGAGTINLQYADQVYYRITVRVDGLHNTVSYVQAVITM